MAGIDNEKDPLVRYVCPPPPPSHCSRESFQNSLPFLPPVSPCALLFMPPASYQIDDPTSTTSLLQLSSPFPPPSSFVASHAQYSVGKLACRQQGG